MESFNEMDLGNGVYFNTVKLFHTRTGTSWSLPPPTRFWLSRSWSPSRPRLHDWSYRWRHEMSYRSAWTLRRCLQSHYYTTTQGRKKLNQVESEIRNLISIHHLKLLSMYASKLNLPHSGPPQLMVLMERWKCITCCRIASHLELLCVISLLSPFPVFEKVISRTTSVKSSPP